MHQVSHTPRWKNFRRENMGWKSAGRSIINDKMALPTQEGETNRHNDVKQNSKSSSPIQTNLDALKSYFCWWQWCFSQLILKFRVINTSTETVWVFEQEHFNPLAWRVEEFSGSCESYVNPGKISKDQTVLVAIWAARAGVGHRVCICSCLRLNMECKNVQAEWTFYMFCCHSLLPSSHCLPRDNWLD